MKFPTIDIYSQKNLYQIFIGINLALIGIASVFYTYNIVESLDAREQRQLTVYAQLIEYQANHPDLNEDYTILFQIVTENIRQSRIPTILVSEDSITRVARFPTRGIPWGMGGFLLLVFFFLTARALQPSPWSWCTSACSRRATPGPMPA